MSATIIDGTAIGKAIREELKAEVAQMKQRGLVPGLSVVLVGEDPASQVYVRMKGKAADELGMKSDTIRLPADTPEPDLLALLDKLNASREVHGILVQLPLPKHMDSSKVLLRMKPEKDVDGFHPVNVGKLVIGDPTGFRPCTPVGVQELLLRSGVDPAGKHVVVVGRSLIVGRPLANIMMQKAKGANATVTVAHTATRDLGAVTRQADILLVAAGKAEVITGNMIKPGAVVIDVGVNRVEDPAAEKGYKLVGDVKFCEAKEVASLISPVPGGVGPMTIALLMRNTVQAARQAA